MMALALIVWVNDDPITGNIIKLSSIVEPRKPFSEYKEGETVRAKCHGFGIVQGVLGKITDENGRKDLEDILKGDRFMLLVKKIKSVSSNDAPSENPHQIQTDNLPEKHEQKKTPKGKIQRKKEQKENKPPKRKTLEDVADDLELTSLETDVGEEVRKIQNTLDVLRETHQVLHEESGTEEPSKDEQVQKAPRLHGEYQTQNQVLENQLKFVQQDLYNANCRINQLENNFQWLWNYVQQMQCNATPQNFSGNMYCEQNAQAGNVTETEPVSELLDTSSVSLEGAPEMSADKCVGGYSDQQLFSRINGMESYRKQHFHCSVYFSRRKSTLGGHLLVRNQDLERQSLQETKIDLAGFTM
ncbi:uncharacterized protein LOC123558217 [Mercenaria mercenaria]|uniref:uncharacterized protein LOC123558217 n=1 Tax=Mercenaria mercenaria TaxID=6596 RepID=UPI00234E823C|nr:uncharacterized protein LOC123558217 [Mercenaria mercenaria]